MWGGQKTDKRAVLFSEPLTLGEDPLQRPCATIAMVRCGPVPLLAAAAAVAGAGRRTLIYGLCRLIRPPAPGLAGTGNTAMLH